MTPQEWLNTYIYRHYKSPTVSEGIAADIIRSLMAENKELVRQHEEITDLCIVAWVSTMGTLKEKVLRLIEYEVSVALDPRVSESAQELAVNAKKEVIDRVRRLGLFRGSCPPDCGHDGCPSTVNGCVECWDKYLLEER